jgi:endonuclease/exonuclease/phosphatase family metal-dependent hydrolase
VKFDREARRVNVVAFEPDLSDSGTFWLSDTPWKPGSRTWGNEIPRVAAWLRLIDRSTHRGFYVFNTHWDHRHQGSRERAAVLMAQRIDARKHPHEPVALMGDFNAVEENPALAYLTGAPISTSNHPRVWRNPLIDTFQKLHPAEIARATMHRWSGSREGGWKLDHILVSKGAEVLSANIRDGDEPVVSDHFPLTARVAFSN